MAHCLGITSPDPLRLNLYFERFLNPARSTPPDIDTDLCSRRRDGRRFSMSTDHYGADRVAMVATLNCFRERSALRETAKAHGLPPSEAQGAANGRPAPPLVGAARQPQRRKEAPYADLSEQYPAPRYQALFRDAATLLGRPRHLSIHPGGRGHFAGAHCDWSTWLAPKGIVTTQFDLDWSKRAGLVKIDLLGIRGLTVLGSVARAVWAARPRTRCLRGARARDYPPGRPGHARADSGRTHHRLFSDRKPRHARHPQKEIVCAERGRT